MFSFPYMPLKAHASCVMLGFLFQLFLTAQSTLTSSKVRVLTETSIDSFIEGNDVSAVMFYAPWCEWSRAALPMWKVAAEKLSIHKPPIHLGILDCAQFDTVRSQYNIAAYPTIKLFTNGQEETYPWDMPRQWTSLVNWVNEKVDRTHELTTLKEATQFFHENHLAVIGLFTDECNVTEYQKSTRNFKDIAFAMSFGTTLCNDIIAYLFSSGKLTERPYKFPAIIMIFEHDERHAIYEGDMSSFRHIDAFIISHRRPLLTNISPQNAEDVLTSRMPTVVLFRNEATEVGKSVENALREAAQDYRGRALFAISGVNDQLSKILMEHLGVDSNDNDCEKDAFGFKPSIRLIYHPNVTHFGSVLNNLGTKYKLHRNKNSPLCSSPDYFRMLVSEFLSGSLPEFIKSEPIPTYESAGGVKTVVGENWSTEVLDEKMDVLVNFFAPWCGHCRRFASTYEEMGLRLRKSRGLKITKIDATLNEVRGVDIMKFPTILLFPAKEKNNPVEYSGDRSIESFISFLKDHVHNEIEDSPLDEVSPLDKARTAGVDEL